jgi:hypothetical protein
MLSPAERDRRARQRNADDGAALTIEDGAALDGHAVLPDTIEHWRAAYATRKPICFWDTVGSFLLSTSAALHGCASIAATCVTCWLNEMDAEIEPRSARMLQRLLPRGRFADPWGAS